MTERILKFGGIDPLSRSESDHGDLEPDRDPRGGNGTEILRGMHMMSAAEQLEPCATTGMAYFDPDAPDMTLEELDEAVRDGRLSLEEVMTKTERFTPLVNPRRARLKDRGEITRDSDADLWHVPTKNYQAMPPVDIFSALARTIDDNDNVANDGVYGEFRERRNGGEVFGEVWFEDFGVGAIDNDPVLLGFEFGWNYFGDRAFYYQPYAQQTQCKNSVAPLDDKQVVMHHNRNPNFRQKWTEALEDLGIYGDELTTRIQEAQQILYEFDGRLEEQSDLDDVIPMPMTLEAFYEHLGFPDPDIPSEHAREAARASNDAREDANRINAWHLHSGATYWLSWHWSGSEDSQAFRGYRSTANDMLFNPHGIASRAQRSFEDDVQQEIIREVVGEGASLEDADPEQRAEIEERMNDNEAIVTVRSGVEAIEEMVDEFRDTEERLDRIQEAMQGG